MALEGLLNQYFTSNASYVFALDFWRFESGAAKDSYKHRTYYTLYSEANNKTKEAVNNISDYLSIKQPRDLTTYSRDHAISRSKRSWETSDRYICALQTGHTRRFDISDAFQGVHFESRSIRTNTNFCGGHWPKGINDTDTWPYKKD